jgi:hypothetical protein
MPRIGSPLPLTKHLTSKLATWKGSCFLLMRRILALPPAAAVQPPSISPPPLALAFEASCWSSGTSVGRDTIAASTVKPGRGHLRYAWLSHVRSEGHADSWPIQKHGPAAKHWQAHSFLTRRCKAFCWTRFVPEGGSVRNGKARSTRPSGTTPTRWKGLQQRTEPFPATRTAGN